MKSVIYYFLLVILLTVVAIILNVVICIDLDNIVRVFVDLEDFVNISFQIFFVPLPSGARVRGVGGRPSASPDSLHQSEPDSGSAGPGPGPGTSVARTHQLRRIFDCQSR